MLNDLPFLNWSLIPTVHSICSKDAICPVTILRFQSAPVLLESLPSWTYFTIITTAKQIACTDVLPHTAMSLESSGHCGNEAQRETYWDPICEGLCVIEGIFFLKIILGKSCRWCNASFVTPAQNVFNTNGVHIFSKPPFNSWELCLQFDFKSKDIVVHMPK